MILVWRGLGILVVVAAFASLVVTESVTEFMLGDDTYYQAHGWPRLVALFVAGAASWRLGTYLNKRPGRVLLDKGTGHEVLLKPDHSLFFIRMEYWGPILVLLGIVSVL